LNRDYELESKPKPSKARGSDDRKVKTASKAGPPAETAAMTDFK